VKRLLLGLGIGLGAAAFLAGGTGAARADQPPNNVSEPQISGNAKVGQTLSASTGTWDGDTPMSFSFQWRQCASDGHSCDDINGAIGRRYVVRHDDINHRLRVRVTAQNSAGSDSADSNPTDVVVPAGGTPPHNTSRPRVTGDFHEGSTLTASVGNWTGTQPISFTFQWQRCPPSHDCFDLSGETDNNYRLTSVDVGNHVRVVVVGRNPYGSDSASSPLDVPIVQARGNAPAATSAPTISGTPQVGAVLTLNPGTWSGSTPLSSTYAWQRCNASGADCARISGAHGRDYKVSTADVGATLRVAVTVSNRFGTTSVLTAATGVVTSPQPTGAIKLPSGLTSVPVSDVSVPLRLIIDQVSYNPRVLRSHAPFTASFRVRDTRGYVVRGALVYVVGIPFDRIAPVPEVATGMDGVATVQLVPTANLPLIRGGYLVLFVRARKPGESVLAGVSNRRLVSVRTGRP
jgi:hypothetical protein